MKTLLLSLNDVEKCLSLDGVINAVEEGYMAFQKNQLDQPAIQSMEMPAHNGETDIKSCYNEGNEAISVKIVSGFYNNGKVNELPTMIGTVLLYDGTTGVPLCIMDGSLITGVRTGAAGAVSCKYLARKNSKIAAVLGTGGQARMQIYAICRVLKLEEIRVYGRSPKALMEYKGDIEHETGVKVTVCSTPEEAMRGADIAVSTTPSKVPMVDESAIRKGMHIIAVGADMAGKNEWDPGIFRDAKVICDSTCQCLSRGETRNAVEARVIEDSDIFGEIGEIILGTKPGRESDEEITIFDTTGMGVQDNVTALNVYETAKKLGLGQYFEFM